MIRRSNEIAPEEKRHALEDILESDAFARADQLKFFLKYVCEMELSGRSAAISEYAVAVEALGRPKSFSPLDDASVRNRAYALRKKLDKYYTDERPDAPIRIEFIKGTYVPRFYSRDFPPPPEPVLTDEHVEIQIPLPAVPPRVRRWPVVFVLALGVAAGLLLGGFGAFVAMRPKTLPAASLAALDPIVREAWGPLLLPQSNVLICLGIPAQLTLIPFDIKMEWRPKMPVFAAPRELIPWYVRHHRFFNGEHLVMDPDENSPHFGDVLGATTAIRILTAAGSNYRLVPERVVSTAMLETHNRILFGVPYKSEAILKLLEAGSYQFVYDHDLRDITIVRGTPGSRGRVYASKRDERDDRVESYTVITVSSTELAGGGAERVLAFSGDPSAGAAAAVEFFSSPRYLADFKRRLKAEGYATFPAAYQILLRCKLDSNLPKSFAYEDHVVLRRD
jgi:hypothetical protein